MTEIGKKLQDLRVAELKEELEKRKLDMMGPKTALVERLEKALRDEGKDPSKHVFGAAGKVAAIKQSQRKKTADAAGLVKVKQEPVDADVAETQKLANIKTETANGHSDEEEHEHERAQEDAYENATNEDDDEVDQVGTVDDECVIIEDDDDLDETAEENEEQEEVEENDVDEHQQQQQAEKSNKAVQPNNHDDDDEDTNAANNDNDESINLTIGEDEQKLLHDEAPDDKEKTVIERNVKDKSNATAKEKILKNTMANNKDDKKNANDKKELAKAVTPKPQRKQAAEKKTDSSSKTSSTIKTNSKDNKEKASNATTNATSSTVTAATTTSATTENAAGKTSTSSSNVKDSSASKSTTGAATAASASKSGATPSRNLWVSGLSSLTRASDLKTIFTKHGKVIGAKVVTNTRTPGTRCYGYVTMSSAADASRCIEHLHHTELHGRIISVERTKNEIGTTTSATAVANKSTSGKTSMAAAKTDGNKKSSNPSKSVDDKSRKRASSSSIKRDDKKSSERATDKHAYKHSSSSSKDIKKDDRISSSRRAAPTARAHHAIGGRPEPHHRPYRPAPVVSQHERDQRQRERERERDREQRIRQQRDILSYQKIREERERQRLRERERELREEERRRREIRERQREEESRLLEERKKLALERERLERDKAELLRLERERQKQEREKIELERLELKRHMKIIQTRDEPVKRISKRDDHYADSSERKRAAGADRFEAPPPPRFDTSLVPPRSYSEKKREDYVGSASSKRLDYAKRDDYVSTGSKRAAIDDYVGVPTKRSSNTEYLSASTKRAIDDYSKRDEYKREVEIRHLPPTGSSVVGGSSSFHSANRDLSSSIHKPSNRYVETERSSSNYRRSGLEDMRKLPNFRPSTASGSAKRYDSSSGGGYAGSSGAGTTSASNMWPPASAHLPHSSHGSNGMSSVIHSTPSWQKSMPVDETNWRPMQSSAPDHRYDRTYNERSGGGGGASGAGYPSSGGGAASMYGSSAGRSAPDRYGPQVSSRY